MVSMDKMHNKTGALRRNACVRGGRGKDDGQY